MIVKVSNIQLGTREIYNSATIISFPVLFPVNCSCQKGLIMGFDFFFFPIQQKSKPDRKLCLHSISFVNVVIKSGLKRAGDTLLNTKNVSG